MMISMIAAMANQRVIGAENSMPWHLPADLRHFKAVTLGKPVIMGRNTYESIGKGLPGRHNIVISRQRGLVLPDADVVENVQQALQLAGDVDEVMVIGGGQIYQALLPQAQRLYLTFIDADVDGDTQFPDYQQQGSWKTVDSQCFEPDESNPYAYRFVTLERQ